MENDQLARGTMQMMITTQEPVLGVVANRARRRIMRRLMPFLFVLYVVAYLDRVNVCR